MKTRAGIALLLAGVLGSSAGPIGSANAQDPIADTVCQAGQDAAISRMFTAILKSRVLRNSFHAE